MSEAEHGGFRAPAAPAAPAVSGASWALGSVVAELRAAGRGIDGARQKLGRQALPSREVLVGIARDLRAVFFPAHFGPADLTEEGTDYFVGHTLDAALLALHEQVRRGLGFPRELDAREAARREGRAAEIVRDFAAGLPAVQELLETDVRAAFEGDPAATSIDEAVFCYPGITAIMHHRIAHLLYTLGVPLIPRILSEIAHADTGIDIHPGAEIGASFFIDHGTGVVIGETCRIGERVRLYQGVTLGAKSFPRDASGNPIKGIDRHPIVEDQVVVYAGATILGRITIGRGSSIGGNVWLTRSVPPNSRISQAQVRSDVFEDGGGI
ncbi:srpH2 [Sorangium cellulosum So ce56]|uniref:SrpH2 protein n=1 Tax=Sorangium cellulosum (strain So ce56) TaxID=448385 RepID=A9F9U2_SORC5|nr:serine O-acetyltransferase EpsC [Sorangium cellulosum]CAN94803.1 srpH2 [Sorangium cellulosum So ce56]